MKSIMEEASSIVKAIEKGWNSAGQPKEFTIKVFEEPQKNFIGMTTVRQKSASFLLKSAHKKLNTAREPKTSRRPVKAEKQSKKARHDQTKRNHQKRTIQRAAGSRIMVQEPQARANA